MKNNQNEKSYMATVKVKLRPSTIEGIAGIIYYQITHCCHIRHISTDLHILRKDWDADIIKELLGFNYTIKQNRIAKLRKMLSKAKKRSNMYDKRKVPAYRLAKMGCYDNLHDYSQQIKKEFLWASQATTPVGKTYSATTATDESDVYGSSSYSGGGSAKNATTTPIYKVGQELADGYVFYVDATGQHGKIVSKTVRSNTPGKVATFQE